MTSRAFWGPGVERLRAVMERHTTDGTVPGLVWLTARRGDVHAGAAGVMDRASGEPIERLAIFRIASLTKAVTAAAAASVLEDCVLRLDEPVDRWLPELAERRVLRRQAGPLDDTVPAQRAITVRDLLAFTCGYGYDFTADTPQAQVAEMDRLGLGVGPPAPASMPDPDAWIAALGTVPLDHQPGAAWRYHTGSEILGVLLARATGQPLGDVLRERIFDPLGMADTGFWVAPERQERLTTCYVARADGGETYDPPAGQWSSAPTFPSGGGGLVSTVDDFAAFGRMLLSGGRGRSGRILSRPSVEAMTTDRLDPGGPGIVADGSVGWGFGVDVQRRRTGPTRSPGSYGWVGGLGTAWLNDPALDLVAVLFTTEMLSSPAPPAVMADFWSAAYAALDD